MKRIASVALWSVIAAAFIGPGTVTSCASSGSLFGPRLLWALSFSTVACLVLQEAAARLALLSGKTLGEALRPPARGGVGASWMAWVAGAAILTGCAAYEAGNILGAVAGFALVLPVPGAAVAAILGGIAALLLWFGTTRAVVRVMSLLVAVMGVAFAVTAAAVGPAWSGILSGAALPSTPSGSGTLVLALIGTTVVPYNLFLGSGIARDQAVGEMRFGLAVAVILGGLISMAIVIVGTSVAAPFSFERLAFVLQSRLGPAGRWLFASGLFAAGFSSMITAPLAASLTLRGLAGGDRWGERGWRARAVWIAVLVCGVGFGASGVQPVPAIVLAQALNGVLLPIVAAFLLLVINDRRLLGRAGRNGVAGNAAGAAVVAVAVLIGATGVVRAVATVTGMSSTGAGPALVAALIAVAAGAVPFARAVRRRRR